MTIDDGQGQQEWCAFSSDFEPGEAQKYKDEHPDANVIQYRSVPDGPNNSQDLFGPVVQTSR